MVPDEHPYGPEVLRLRAKESIEQTDKATLASRMQARPAAMGRSVRWRTFRGMSSMSVSSSRAMRAQARP